MGYKEPTPPIHDDSADLLIPRGDGRCVDMTYDQDYLHSERSPAHTREARSLPLVKSTSELNDGASFVPSALDGTKFTSNNMSSKTNVKVKGYLNVICPAGRQVIGVGQTRQPQLADEGRERWKKKGIHLKSEAPLITAIEMNRERNGRDEFALHNIDIGVAIVVGRVHLPTEVIGFALAVGSR
ncbi:hypothetical protein EVAR_9562_1 [Eumeta japonica]|uniref:Uncharacterized protein n=1 Tax=Eumeta variegata TaxID=151549 RepID=A0A4C1U3X0_EUMVA|nr:hypothetical protein EVAR_9562_1 [Eumeta japonica]